MKCYGAMVVCGWDPSMFIMLSVDSIWSRWCAPWPFGWSHLISIPPPRGQSRSLFGWVLAGHLIGRTNHRTGDPAVANDTTHRPVDRIDVAQRPSLISQLRVSGPPLLGSWATAELHTRTEENNKHSNNNGPPFETQSPSLLYLTAF